VVSRKFALKPIVGVVLLLIVPLAVGASLAVWALSVSPLQSDAPVAPLIAQVQTAARSNSGTTSVTVVPAGERIVKSQASGLVTQIDFTIGDSIGQGEIAMWVEGLPIFAYVAATPLHRDISNGMTGQDVSTAQQLLSDMGYLTGVDGVVGPNTVAAIRAFNSDAGRGSTNSVLSLSSLLWIPVGSGEPRTVEVEVGDEITRHTPLYTAVVGSPSITIDTEGSSVNRIVTVGTATVPLGAGQTSITDPEDVAALLDQIGGETSAVATVADAEPAEVGTVPASSVIADAAGGVCYFTGPDGKGEPVSIAAAAGASGVVDVDPSLIGTPVLVNPRETRSDLSCNS